MRLRFFAPITLLVITATLIFSQNTVFAVSTQIDTRNTPGVTITQSNGSNSISESGTTDNYTVVLDTPPTDTVNVSISYPASDVVLNGDTDGTFNTTFTTINWNAPQTITIAPVNDSVIEGNHTTTLTHSFASSDNSYNAITPRVDGTTGTNNLVVSIADNEDATVSVTGTSLVSEAIGTTNAVVTLTTTDGATLENAVTIPLNLVDNTAVFNGSTGDMYMGTSGSPVNTTNVTFAAGAANGATQNVTININDDRTAERSASSVASFNTNENFSVTFGTIPGIVTTTTSSVTVNIDENDFAYVTMSPNAIYEVSEAGGTVTAFVRVRILSNGSGTIQVQDAFTVPVETQFANVIGGNNANAGADYTALSTTVSFPSGTLNDTEQPVTVTIINDSIDEFYGALNAFNQNQEFFEIGFSGTTIRNTYAGVPILIPNSANDNCDGSSPSIPNFSSAGGATPCRDRTTIGILDNDTAAVTVTESGGNTAITEGGASDSYTVVLTSQPTSNVTINVAFTQTQVSLNGDTDGTASLFFTTANWSIPQTVTVTAVNDGLIEANPHTTLIAQTITSSDLVYNAINPNDVTVSITDNDTATIVFSNNSSTASELSTPHIVTARLDLVTNGSPGGSLSGALTANVNVALGTAEATDFTQTTTQVAFGAGSTNGATQDISFGIVNDRLLEGGETFTVSYALASGTGSVSGSHTVTITDDETGVITFNAASSTAAEGTTPHNVGVALTITSSGLGNVQVENNVTVAIINTPGTASTPSDYTTATPIVTFSSGTNSPISGTIATTIVNDTLVEAADETFTLGFGTVTGSTAVTASGTHGVTIDENDTATVNFGGGAVLVSEAAGTYTRHATLSITANPSSPTPSLAANVVVPVNYVIAVEAPPTSRRADTPADFTLVTTSITFPASSVAGATQAVNVTIVNDSIDERRSVTDTSGREQVDIELNNNVAAFAPNITLINTNMTLAIDDNDTSNITVNQTTVAVSENLPSSANYTVVLATQPTANVTVNLTFDATQITVNGDTDGAYSLTFTAANWNSAQTITVQAVDDIITEGAHSSQIAQTASSSDTKYNAVNPANVTVNITDNDVPGSQVVESGGNTAVSEANVAASDSYTIRLDSRPTQNVTVNMAFDATQISLVVDGTTFTTSPATFAIIPNDWNVLKTVQVIAVDDGIDEANTHTTNITQTFVSTDANYHTPSGGINPADVTVTITDNDTVTITLVNGSSSIGEATTSHSVTARLDILTNGTPGGTLSGNVVANVNVAPDTTEASDFTQNTAQVSFTSGASNGATLPINFTITNDRLLEGDETFTVSLVLSSGGGSVSGSHTVTLNDDESGAITFSTTSSNVSEGTATHNVPALLTISGTGTGNLQLENNASVAINQAAGTATTPADYTLTTTNLTFPTSSNSPISGTITTALVNDVLVEKDETYSLGFGTVTGSGMISASDTHTVTITENDTAVVAFVSNDDTVLEASGTFSKTAILTITPNGTGTGSLAADFVIPITFTELGALEPEDFTLALTSITFPAGSTSGTTRIPGANIVNDPIDEDTESFEIALSNVNATPYMTLGRSTTNIAITDDDMAAITVNPTTGVVSEGSSTGDAYDVVLTSKPTADVTISLSFDQAQVTVNGDTDGSLDLTFTTTNWSTAQTVTVLAVDDVDVEGAHTSAIAQTASSIDTKYAAVNPEDVTVNITDNDSAGVILTEINPPANVDESNTVTTFTYNVRLTSRPAQGVNVAVIFDPAQVSLNGDTDGILILTFTGSNWNSAQDVTVTVIDDNIDESATTYAVDITHDVSSTDPNYANKTAAPFQPDDTITLTITDNDAAAITINPAPLAVSESGTNDTYMVRALTQPRADVTVQLTFDSTQIRVNGQGSPYEVILTSLNYSVDVTVSAVDDALAEVNPHTVQISHTSSSSDTPYDTLVLDSVSVNITDNETAAVVVSPTTITVTEGGAGTSYTVQLTSEPTGDVVVTLTFDDAIIRVGTGTTGDSTQTLTFTVANWMIPQTVNVIAVDDSTTNNFVSTTIVQETISTDTDYNNVSTSDVVVNISEDDIAGVVFINEDGSALDLVNGVIVSEGGVLNDTYGVKLGTQPLGEVTLNLMFDHTQLQVATNGGSFQTSPVPLIFNATNWNTPQMVSVTALEDFTVDAGTEFITYDVSSLSDAVYNALPDENITVTVQEGTSTGPDAFAMTSPADKTVIPDAATLTTFTWQDTLKSGIGGLTFDLTITRVEPEEPDVIALAFTDITRTADSDTLTCDGTRCVLTLGESEQALLLDGVYQWTVTAKNPLGSTVAINAPFTFRVGVAPAELIINGSFETPGATGKDADAWVMKRKLNDNTETLLTGPNYKRKCKPGITLAYDGDCAFVIKLTGFSNWNYFLLQKIKNPNVGVDGDTLLLTAYIRTKDLQQSARLSFIVLDSSGDKQKLYREIAPGTNDYTQLQIPANFKSTPVKIVVRFETGQNYGNIFIDAVRLTVVASANPLQDAPVLVPLPVTTDSASDLLPLPATN